MLLGLLAPRLLPLRQMGFLSMKLQGIQERGQAQGGKQGESLKNIENQTSIEKKHH